MNVCVCVFRVRESDEKAKKKRRRGVDFEFEKKADRQQRLVFTITYVMWELVQLTHKSSQIHTYYLSKINTIIIYIFPFF